MKVYFTKGLPASGKTTWANEFVKTNPDTIIVCKDDIRAKGIKNEKEVIKVRDRLIREALGNKLQVISADTNLNPIHEETIRKIADEYKAEFEVVSFTSVPVETCIKRDAGRSNSVGRSVIMRMYRQYSDQLSSFLTKAYARDLNNLPKVVLCDLDGTVARMVNRSPFEWDKVDTDEPMEKVIDLVKALPYPKIFLSGRDGSCYDKTKKWLNKYELAGDLLMRTAGDNRADDIIKEEIYRDKLEGKYQIVAVIDDRPRVCRMWYKLGLPLFKVGDPDADF